MAKAKVHCPSLIRKEIQVSLTVSVLVHIEDLYQISKLANSFLSIALFGDRNERTPE